MRHALASEFGSSRFRVAAHRSSAPLIATGALAAYAILSPTLSFAQQTTSTDKVMPTVKVKDEGEEVELPVTQLGKTPQLLRDIPQTVTVLNHEVLDAQGVTTLGEALRNVPGITLSAGEGGNIGDNVNLRGFSARTDLYLDGIRDRGQYSRDTFFLDSVEVLKGPSSMLFGRGSTGGVINQVSKLPKRRAATSVGVSVGTDSYYRATADMNRPIGESTAFRVAAFGHSAESTRDIVESERYGIAPSLRFGIGTPTEITLSAMIQHRDEIPDYGFPFATVDGTVASKTNLSRPISVPRENFLGFTDDRFEQDVNVLAARISHDFSPNATLRSQLQFNSADIFARPTTITATGVRNPPPINAEGVRNPRQREIEDRSLFNQTDLIVRVGEGTLRHTITAGVEIGRDDYENQTYNTTPPATNSTAFNQLLVNPMYGPLPTNSTIAPNTFTDNVGKTLAVYANDQLDIGDHWKLVGGLRWDRFEFDSNVTTNSTGAMVVTPTKTDKMTSTRLGLLYQPDAIQTYYVSYGTSFNPSAETLTLSTANQNVDPEENRSFELGAKLSYNEGQLLVTGALFRVDKTNARTTDIALGTVLDGDIRVQGVEFGISGAITSAWKMLAGYAYLDSEIVKSRVAGETGNAYPNTPKHSASLWSTYALPHNWEIGGGLIYVDDRWLNNANTAITDSYARADATAAYVTDRYTVRVNLQNLTDKVYFGTASAGRATPATGRSAIATFGWNF